MGRSSTDVIACHCRVSLRDLSSCCFSHVQSATIRVDIDVEEHALILVFVDMPSEGNGELVVPHPPLDTPALRDDNLNFSYAIARGEMGVLSFEPYKSTPLPCSD